MLNQCILYNTEELHVQAKCKQLLQVLFMVSMVTLPSFAQATQIYGVTFTLLQSKMGKSE